MVRAHGWIHFSLRGDKWHCTRTVLVPVLLPVGCGTVSAPFLDRYLKIQTGETELWYSASMGLSECTDTMGNLKSIIHILLFICCDRYKYSSTFLCLLSGRQWYSIGRGINAGHQSNAGKFSLCLLSKLLCR